MKNNKPTGSPIPFNNPRDVDAINNMVELFNCMLDGKTAAYISAPITTGQRFIDWYKETGSSLDHNSSRYKTKHFHAVIRPNSEEVKKKVVGIRRHFDTILINPTLFTWPEWNQDDYRHFWGKIIETYVDTVIFLNGWQYSSGCSFEFLTAVRSGIEVLDEDRDKLDRETGLRLIEDAIAQYNKNAIPSVYLERVASELAVEITSGKEGKVDLEHLQTSAVDKTQDAPPPGDFLKDEILNRLAKTGNVAQFVSFGADMGLPQRYARISGFEPNHLFSSPGEAIEALLTHSPEGTVNIRSFQPGKAQGEPLLYGIDNVEEVLDIAGRKAGEEKITIVNETIDVDDGGVSGVLLGHTIEFSPGDTPKCVDKPGVCRVPRNIGLNILEQVYGFRPALNYPFSYRVEFSIHPKKRGIRHSHTIIWELEKVNVPDNRPRIDWPNNFSRFLGDKAYGLLIADALGLPVPLTTVITRNTAPFTIGRKTGTAEIWIRTCPEVRMPGKYPTYFGWHDPFELMTRQDLELEKNPEQVRIISVLAQEAVEPEFSGSLIAVLPEGKEPHIEGVRGPGDKFMLGEMPPQDLPGDVTGAVRELYHTAFQQLGPVEIEWVYDGRKAWVVQLHKSEAAEAGEVVFPGEPETFIRFEVEQGLDALRSVISEIKEKPAGSEGIILIGDIGITSHFGDLLRKAKIPGKIERQK